MNWKQKLSSRKLWAAVVGIVMGIAMVFGLDEGVVTDIAGAVVSIASVITYIVTEGKVDANAVKETIEIVQDAVEGLEEGE